MAENVAQQILTVQGLYQAVNLAVAKANQESLRIKENGRRISDLFRKARAIPDPQLRQAALDKLAPISRQQAKVILDYRAFVARWKSLVEKAATFLRPLGLSLPAPANLEGLGALPVVPLAIAAGLALAAAYLVQLATNNAAISRGVAAHERAYNDMMDGRLTYDQYRQVTQNINETTSTAAAAGAAGSWQQTIQSLVPVGLIVLAIMLVPQLLKLMPGKAARA